MIGEKERYGQMKVRSVGVAAALLLNGSVVAEENLLRDDFASDNIGGHVGWTFDGDANVLVRTWLLPGSAVAAKPAIRLVGKKIGACPSDYKFRTSAPLPLVAGGHYRLSAEVRTHGLENLPTRRFVIAEEGWQSGNGARLPADTSNEWVKVTWEGELTAPSKSGDYICSLYCCSSAAGFPDDAWVDLRAPRLEGPTRPGYDRRSHLKVAPLPIRITPVDPLLSEINAERAVMRFYCPSADDGSGARGRKMLLRATLGDRSVSVPFGKDHFATTDFGAFPAGQTVLRAELVDAASGVSVATNAYRAFVREEVRDVTPLKRLNNLVSEVFRRPFEEGEIPLVLGKRVVLYLAVTDPHAEIKVEVDGQSVSLSGTGDGPELMRSLKPGRHSIRVSGRAEGDLVVRVVKDIHRSGVHLASRMRANFAGFFYGERFLREFGLLTGFNSTSFWHSYESAPETMALVRRFEENGVSVARGVGFGAIDPRRLDFASYLACVTNPSCYRAGLHCEFDENPIFPLQGGVAKANTAEVWWHAYDEGRALDVFFEDGQQSVHRYPEVDIPELSAYANSGDGSAKIISEVYYRSPETQEDVDRIAVVAKEQVRAMREMQPAAPSRYSYLLNGWMMIGGYTSCYSPAADMRVLNAKALQMVATDPEFADIGGISFSTPACYEDYLRFIVAAMRYYGIEGGTGDFAAMNGMALWPGHLKNGDFQDGFAGWTVSPAGRDTLMVRHIDFFAGKWQGRQYSSRYKGVPQSVRPGNDFALFTCSDKAPNVLRQKIVGLKPGRVYQLTFAISDLATVEKGMKEAVRRNAKPVNIPYLRVSIPGAEEIPELRHVFDDLGKYGKRCVFPNRVVFRAKSSEAEAVFCDWTADGRPGVRTGQQTTLNYIGVSLYYHKDEAQLEKLRKLTQEAKDMVRD